MSEKRIKNEQWTVKELISKINNKEINKPKFQRKKKWVILKVRKIRTLQRCVYFFFYYDF